MTFFSSRKNFLFVMDQILHKCTITVCSFPNFLQAIWLRIKYFYVFMIKFIIKFCFNIILMQEGNRNTLTYDQAKTLSNCECVFLLRRVSQASGNFEIKVDFSPAQIPQSSSISDSSQYFSTLPIFNKDNRYFTPSFILEEDKVKLDEKQSQILANHQRKVDQFLEQKDQLLLPKPSKANRFCLICKEAYDDYLTHITYPSHNKLLKQSPFYNDVVELCLKKNPKNNFKFNKKISKQPKKKEVVKVNQKQISLGRQKSTEAHSTGLQSSQVQLCISAK